MRTRSARRPTGNMSALMLAVFLAVLMSILLFGLSFARFLGGHQQQITAIDAATLAVANDLNKIVVEDPNFGFISLSDYPPIGSATKAGDDYFLPVTGINALQATIRLNMIVADALNDKIMSAYALRDWDNANLARTRLVDALNQAVREGGTGTDIDGRTITPMQDALAAYQSNRINMTSGASTLAPGSFKISLGWITGIETNMPIPSPSKYAQLDADQQQNGHYKANVNVAYGGCAYVFAALEDQTALVSGDNFRSADDPGSLPFVIPTIVKCEADQQFRQTEQFGRDEIRVVHAQSFAVPGCLLDARNNPGAFTVSFADGTVPEIDSMYALFTAAQINKSPSDGTQTPTSGDFPPNKLSNLRLPILNSVNAPFGQCLRVALHDWLRAIGPRLNVESLVSAMQADFSVNPGPHAEVFSIDKDGAVVLSQMPIKHAVSLPVSNDQWAAVTGLAFHSTNKEFYDFYCKDFVYQPGRIKGGIHAGQPIGDTVSTDADSFPANTIGEDPAFVAMFPNGPNGGAVRGTYAKNGIACDIRVRKR